MRTESLSFTLRRVESARDLLRACQVRAEAYGYRIPEYRQSMARPDRLDESPWTTLFLCEDKVSGKAVGTMRIQTRRPETGELEMERYVELPDYLQRSSCAEVTRLAAPIGADPFVRLALWKAAYLFSVSKGISWILMTVRKPALIRAYERMGSRNVFPEPAEGFCLPYVGALPHKIYALDIDNFYDFWSDSKHPLLEFMTATVHDDIKIDVALVNRRAVVELRFGVVE